MTENTSTETTAVDTTDDSTLADQPVTASEFASKEEFEKGSWQATVQQSSVLFKRSGDAKKRASNLLWTGATQAISEWEANSDSDVNAEGLATDLLIIMGTSRKGDVSKIKTVALAVLNEGLDTSAWPNLSKAYGEAIRLTKTAAAEKEEDNAGEEAIQAVAADAPKTASTPESAIKMALALTGDFDEFFKVMLDVINSGGDENVAAHRAALRSLAQEVSGRAKPAPAPAPASGDKAGATQATATPAAETAVAAPAKPRKAPAQTSVPTETGAPAAKGNGQTKPRQATAPVEASQSDEAGDIFSEVDAEDTPAPVAPAPAKKTSAPRPRRA